MVVIKKYYHVTNLITKKSYNKDKQSLPCLTAFSLRYLYILRTYVTLKNISNLAYLLLVYIPE